MQQKHNDCPQAMSIDVQNNALILGSMGPQANNSLIEKGRLLNCYYVSNQDLFNIVEYTLHLIWVLATY